MKKPRRKREDPEFEIRFIEGVVARRPHFIEALVALGDLYTRRGFYHKGLQADQKLAGLRPHDPVVLYNLACSYALLHRLDEALRVLQSAIRYGYREWDHLQRDPDLDNLRRDERWDQLTRVADQYKTVV